jgi:hypothetical protein
MALLLNQALFDDFSWYCTIPVFLVFANKVSYEPVSQRGEPGAPSLACVQETMRVEGSD